MYNIHCICMECGIFSLKKRKMMDSWQFWPATFSKSVCEWCFEITDCTEPRDYGYPEPLELTKEQKKLIKKRHKELEEKR